MSDIAEFITEPLFIKSVLMLELFTRADSREPFMMWDIWLAKSASLLQAAVTKEKLREYSLRFFRKTFFFAYSGVFLNHVSCNK